MCFDFVYCYLRHFCQKYQNCKSQEILDFKKLSWTVFCSIFVSMLWYLTIYCTSLYFFFIIRFAVFEKHIFFYVFRWFAIFEFFYIYIFNHFRNIMKYILLLKCVTVCVSDVVHAHEWLYILMDGFSICACTMCYKCHVF